MFIDIVVYGMNHHFNSNFHILSLKEQIFAIRKSRLDAGALLTFRVQLHVNMPREFYYEYLIWDLW